MTRSDLQTITRKQLAEMARDHQIPGWHAMRKDQLVDALTRANRRRSNGRRRAANGNHSNGRNGSNGNGRRVATSRCRLTATPRPDSGGVRDLLRVEARSPYWLATRWTLSTRILDRAEAALGLEWREAVPVLRIFDLTEDEGTATTQTLVEDVEIRQPVDHWYVCVPQPGRTYRIQLAYRSPTGNVFVLAESAKVTTPREPKSRPNNGGNGRHATAPAPVTYGMPVYENDAESADTDFEFRIDAEVILHGQTDPGAGLTLLDRPLQQRDDGSFTVRLPLEDGRQVIPAECITPTGELRTIVLAVERNTKHLEPQRLNETD